MRDLVINFPAKQKVPVYSAITIASGTFSSVGTGTFTLKDNAGASVTSGNVSGNSTSGLVLSEWVTVDGNSLSFTPQPYILDLSLPVTPSDTIARTETPSILLYVAGTPPTRTLAPTGDDLQAFLVGAGMLSNPPTAAQRFIDLDSAAASAQTCWQEATGYFPLIAATQTRTYDPPGPERGPVGIYVGVSNIGGGRKLFVYDGLLSVSALKVGVTPTNTGTALTSGTDFWLRPQNAPKFNRPYSYIEFALPQWGNPQSITVAGSFGFATSLTEQIWKALLYMAALEVVPHLALLLTGGLNKLTLGNDSFGWNANPFLAQTTAWETHIAKTLGQFKRYNIV